MDKWDEAQIGHYMGVGIQFFYFLVLPLVSLCSPILGAGLLFFSYFVTERTDGFVVGNAVDVSSSGISQIREAWESQRKAYSAEFFELDPCLVSFSFLLIAITSLLYPIFRSVLFLNAVEIFFFFFPVRC